MSRDRPPEAATGGPIASLLGALTTPLQPGLTLVVDNALCDGSFVLYHYLQQELDAGRRVSLVTLAQPRSHHERVCRRLGLHFQRAEGNGRLHVVDVMAAAAAAATEPAEMQRAVDRAVMAAIGETEPAQPPPVLVLDDAGVLADAGAAVADVVALVCRWRAKSSIITLAHRERRTRAETDQHDDDEPGTPATLWRELGHLATSVVEVSGLISGRSRDLDGEIAVRHFGAGGGAGEPRNGTVHFQLGDRRIKFFPPGTAAAVL